MVSHAFTPIKKEPAYLKVARAIESDIRSRRLEPGDALPTEMDLSAQFDLNRSTVREGIRLLEQQGLIERGEAKRLVVASPNALSLAKKASQGMAFSGVTFREVWEALAMIHPPAARLAAQRCDEALIQSLEEVADALESVNEKDDAATVKAATSFFSVLAEALDNRVLAVTLHAMTQLIEASLGRVIDVAPQAQGRILKAQRNIIRAMTERNGEDASLWMARHIEDLKRGYEAAQIDLSERIL